MIKFLILIINILSLLQFIQMTTSQEDPLKDIEAFINGKVVIKNDLNDTILHPILVNLENLENALLYKRIFRETVARIYSTEARKTLSNARDVLEQNREALDKACKALEQNREALDKACKALEQNREALEEARKILEQNREVLEKDHGSLYRKYESLYRKYESSKKAHGYFKKAGIINKKIFSALIKNRNMYLGNLVAPMENLSSVYEIWFKDDFIRALPEMARNNLDSGQIKLFHPFVLFHIAEVYDESVKDRDEKLGPYHPDVQPFEATYCEDQAMYAILYFISSKLEKVNIPIRHEVFHNFNTEIIKDLIKSIIGEQIKEDLVQAIRHCNYATKTVRVKQLISMYLTGSTWVNRRERLGIRCRKALCILRSSIESALQDPSISNGVIMHQNVVSWMFEFSLLSDEVDEKCHEIRKHPSYNFHSVLRKIVDLLIAAVRRLSVDSQRVIFRELDRLRRHLSEAYHNHLRFPRATKIVELMDREIKERLPRAINAIADAEEGNLDVNEAKKCFYFEFNEFIDKWTHQSEYLWVTTVADKQLA